MKPGRALALMGWALPVCAQYAGPAILSRGEVPAAMAAPELHFRPFLEITGVYDSGLAAVGVTNQGGLANQSSPGVAIAWGISGIRMAGGTPHSVWTIAAVSTTTRQFPVTTQPINPYYWASSTNWHNMPCSH